MSSSLETDGATVVITTKNRKDDLRKAIESALGQSCPTEVLVVDDASTDGTASMVEKEFPDVRLEVAETSQGYIAQRNRAARLASFAYIFSIDDDAAFSTREVVEQTLSEFEDPRIGAIAIPYVEPRKSADVHQRAPQAQGVFVTNDFIGTAHALRRDLFLDLGGYRECLVHQGEEGDYCLRMLNAGFVTRLGNADAIHHFESPLRDLSRMDFHGRRNDVLFAWHNVPMPYLPVHLAATTVNGLLAGMRVRRPGRMLRGTLRGYADCLRRWNARDPVRREIYRLNRRLKKGGPMTLDEVAIQLDRVVDGVAS